MQRVEDALGVDALLLVAFDGGKCRAQPLDVFRFFSAHGRCPLPEQTLPEIGQPTVDEVLGALHVPPEDTTRLRD